MSESTVLPFPIKFRPHLAHTEESLEDFIYGPSEDANVTPSDRNGPNFPISPRARFGLRELSDVGPALTWLARGEDRVEVEAFKDEARSRRIGRAGQNARDAFDGKRKVCPTLLLGLAGEVHAAAEALSRCAEKARALGCAKPSLTLVDLASIAEGVGAEIEAPAHGVE